MKGNTALNRAFISFPQLNRLVTTTNSIYKKSHLREQILIRLLTVFTQRRGGLDEG